MAFVKRIIETVITLTDIEGNAQAFAQGGNTVTLANLRTSCKIVKAGGYSDSTMQLTIYGMTRSTMDRLSTLGMQINLTPKNPITVKAGNEGSPLGVVFVGYIMTAYADFDASPNVSFNITAHTLAPDGAINVAPTSFNGNADVATIMAGFAAQMGLKFENNGIDIKVPSPYYWGSVKAQAQACVTQAGIAWNGGDNGILAIWPKFGSRGGAIPLIAPETGLVGYPAYNAYGLMLKTVFNPSIGLGGKVEVKSSLKPANGTWAVYYIDYDLESLVPRGQWLSMIGAYNPVHPTPVVAPTT